ncbi:protein O-mannosyltransferase 1 [Sitodiplosis mosellana]|uniref:protein O-mannosyltransferase 1 n=1 Tax=Sitodiplosis mosellana TaxID=263140 RepID=UPI0024451C04|nr:protein O-mannosyltransferase 1 [Sitodiplosis mosellana]
MDSEVRKRKNRNIISGESKNVTKKPEESRPSNDDRSSDINESDSERIESIQSDGKSITSVSQPLIPAANGAKIANLPEIAIPHKFRITFEIDVISITLFVVALCTRFYRLSEPNNIVFDELHYGKYVSLYLKRTFFFDQHPPLGKQLISAVANFVGYNGNFTFSQIGTEYTENVPIFWLRFVPALCGSLLVPIVYQLLRQLKLSVWTATLGGVLIIIENSLVTQSQFILMEPMLLMFSILAILLLLKYQQCYDQLTETTSIPDRFDLIVSMLLYGVLSAICFTCALCIKYVAIYSCLLGMFIGLSQVWQMLGSRQNTNISIALQVIFRSLVFVAVPIAVYLAVFWIHLAVLNKAGPHDSVMTSAFQASLEGGLASITKGQPLNVAHGSQITLRHTHGRTCWLHSHAHVYPVRYADKRGSSHQQQVTCYSFKDVNNWWIVKRANKDDLVVENDEVDVIKHGDEIQLIHGITSRALNSHDVASAVTPQSQEVSCYIDYNISMPAQNLWKVDILNKASEGNDWHTIKSHVRFIHIVTGAALRFSGRQLPDWGFNQHEIVADRNIDHMDSVWNVEEHRYTKTADQRERERQMVKAEMIPTKPTSLTFFEKFMEIQFKMLWPSASEAVQTHMYSSEPLDWPLMSKGIAYWVDKNSNAQIHLLGNVATWYSGVASLLLYVTLLSIYLLRRRRFCYDIDEHTWVQFNRCGEILFAGYLLHFLPYFFVERTMFLHNYLPALVFKIMLLCFMIEHIHDVVRQLFKSEKITLYYRIGICVWLVGTFYVFQKFSVLTYGLLQIDGHAITADDVIALRWKDTWDFIIHKELS